MKTKLKSSRIIIIIGIVIIVCLILAGLLLPALQRARGSACRNNLSRPDIALESRTEDYGYDSAESAEKPEGFTRRYKRQPYPQSSIDRPEGNIRPNYSSRRAGENSITRLPINFRRINVDEIWIIEKPQPTGNAYQSEQPGSGTLQAKLPDQEKMVTVPLKHTEVTADIKGYIASVEVTQQFQNPYDQKIEAVYVFPLPQDAAVNEFIMTVGDRKIRGIIREREEAERIYKEARRQGYVASLLTQERPNIFTQKVANIEPGKAIDINIVYFNTLAYVDGSYEFVFPMVVGPRFNPPGMTSGVGAAGRGKAGTSGQKTEVQYMRSNERSGHDINITVNLDAGVKIEGLESPTHAIKTKRPSANRAMVSLSRLDRIPNRDFVLRCKVAGRKMKTAFITHKDARGSYFTLMLYPPERLRDLPRKPMEMVFVLDCSGSMSGRPMAKAKEAMKRALNWLGPDDTFQVIRFSNNASQLGPKPIPATPANVRKGLRYVKNLSGSGGTMMIEGIKAALDFPHDKRRVRVVSFMTDGYIGNEDQILGEIHKRRGSARIFSFGVGNGVNRYLLDRMAVLGKGAVAYVGLDESGGKAVDGFYKRLAHPALTDIKINWGDAKVTDIFPRKTPDMYVGRPVTLTGRFTGRAPTAIRVTGHAADEVRRLVVRPDTKSQGSTHKGIPFVWARSKIADLNNQSTYDKNPEIPATIKQVALNYSLMSAYTAFLAVDSSRQTLGDHGVSVIVPVPVPDGVRYETTVTE
jgi:Ca-activated chloride channel homolog